MIITWDNARRTANIAEHGLDFADLEDGAFFSGSLLCPVGDGRFMAFGPMQSGVVLVVFALCESGRILVVSMRSPGGNGGFASPPRDKFTAADLAAVLDGPNWTEADFKRARPFSETFPDLARKPLKSPPLSGSREQVVLRLSPEVIDHFRAFGPDWRDRIDESLKKLIAPAPRKDG